MPAGQAVQTRSAVAVAPLTYWPSAQAAVEAALQATVPEELVHLPAGQARQPASVAWFLAPLKVPGGQAVQPAALLVVTAP